MSTHANMVQMTTATIGTGTITLGSASTGFQSFADAYGADATVDILITDGNAWEVARECTYTHIGTTLTRGTLEDSSTGSALNLTGSATVAVVGTADLGNRLERAMQAIIPGGRLTTESGVPVSTSDRTAQSTIYYTPFVHNTVPLWDGAKWLPTTFAETSLALSGLTSGANYDVFGYLSGGVLALELLVWTNNTTRATDVTLQDGRYAKSGDKTRMYLGTIRTTGTTTTEDSGFFSTTTARKRFVWNAHNRVKRPLCIEENTTNWTYTGKGVWRQVRASTDNQFEFVCGLNSQAELHVEANLSIGVNATGSYAAIGIGYDSISAIATEYGSSFYSGSSNASEGVTIGLHAALNRPLAFGYHYCAWLETFGGAATQMTAYGTLAVARTASMIGWVEA